MDLGSRKALSQHEQGKKHKTMARKQVGDPGWFLAAGKVDIDGCRGVVVVAATISVAVADGRNQKFGVLIVSSCAVLQGRGQGQGRWNQPPPPPPPPQNQQQQQQQQHHQQQFMQPPPHHLQQGPGGHAHPMQHPQSPGMLGFPPSGFSPQHHPNVMPPQHQQPMPPMNLPHHAQAAVMMGMPLSPEQQMSVAMAQMGMTGMAPGMGPMGQIGGPPPPPGLMQDPMLGPGGSPSGMMVPQQGPPGLGGLPIGQAPPPRPPSSTPYRPPLARNPGSPSPGSFQPAAPADQQQQVIPAASFAFLQTCNAHSCLPALKQHHPLC